MADDDPNEMYKQATLGDVDFITGDYLAGTIIPILVGNRDADKKVIRGKHSK